MNSIKSVLVLLLLLIVCVFVLVAGNELYIYVSSDRFTSANQADIAFANHVLKWELTQSSYSGPKYICSTPLENAYLYTYTKIKGDGPYTISVAIKYLPFDVYVGEGVFDICQGGSN